MEAGANLRIMFSTRGIGTAQGDTDLTEPLKRLTPQQFIEGAFRARRRPLGVGHQVRIRERAGGTGIDHTSGEIGLNSW